MSWVYLLGAGAIGATMGYLAGKEAACEVEKGCVYYTVRGDFLGSGAGELTVLEPAACDGTGDLEIKGRWGLIEGLGPGPVDLMRSIGPQPDPEKDVLIDQDVWMG
jgi:hypothetical protein